MIELIKHFFRKNYNLEQVFTPASSAFLTFVERPELEKQIQKAFLIPGMQLILYGHSGSGKTTIIQNYLKENQVNFISTNCLLDTTIDNLILDAFDRLNPYIVAETTIKNTDKLGYDLKASYLGIDNLLKTETSTEISDKKVRALPIQLTPQRLAEFLGASEVVWIIEDFHKVKKEERQKLSQILKIFVDTSNSFKKVKVIAIGAVGTAREVLNYDSELNNRISEIQIPLMTREELISIINKGEKLLNVDFPDTIESEIIKFSNSLAAICHHLCFSLCHNNKVLNTQKIKQKFSQSSLRDAIFDYLKQNSDSFKETLDRALKHRDGKFDSIRNILLTFCKHKNEELTKKDILSYKNNKSHYGSNVGEYLKLLTTAEYGEILRYDDNSGKYSFSNPFFKAYTLMQFETEEKENNAAKNDFTSSIEKERLNSILRILMDDMEKRIEEQTKQQELLFKHTEGASKSLTESNEKVFAERIKLNKQK